MEAGNDLRFPFRHVEGRPEPLPPQAGGPTDLANAVPLCGHHHRRVHDPGRRAERLPNGTLRDTAVYSITADEWPAVRNHLDWQLARPR